MATLPIDDQDLDDPALWAIIDSVCAAASASATSYTSPTTPTARFPKPLPLTHPNFRSPPPKFISPPQHQQQQQPRCFDYRNKSHRPQKLQRSSSSINNASSHSPLVVRQNNNNWPVNRSSEIVAKEIRPYVRENVLPIVRESKFNGDGDKENFRHCLSGSFPSVSLFMDYQNAAMSVLEKTDYIMIAGKPFIKKSGWRKIAFYFNVSFEIKDKTIEFDHNRNVQRAEFLVRAHMQGGRFSDGWGSCDRRENKFMKPNNDIPSTAETRAKNRACQDLISIGQYRPGASHSHFPSPQ